MAISKTQPMRSAEIELVDTVNGLDTDNTENKAALESLQDQIGDGFEQPGATVTSVTSALSRAAQAQSEAIVNITQTIGDTSAIPTGSSIMGMLSQLAAFSGRFRIGETEELEITDGSPYASSEVFATPFGQADNCILYAQVISGEPINSFDLTIIDCTNTGFSYSVVANDTDPYTIRIGYVAVCTNA